MYPNLRPLSPTTSQASVDAWSLALDIAAARASDRYPSDTARIGNAVKLIRTDMVHIQADGSAHVQSRRIPSLVYHVNGRCQCEAVSRAADRGDLTYRCAHRWAKALYKKALLELTRLHSATCAGTEGFAYALPEDSGYAFFAAQSAVFRIIPQYHAALVLHGRCAWVEDGQLVGMVPQAATDAAKETYV